MAERNPSELRWTHLLPLRFYLDWLKLNFTYRLPSNTTSCMGPHSKGPHRPRWLNAGSQLMKSWCSN
ncbi:hypothetical protein PGTUg99_015758 [Puccinia graminis f. sp. tritici]|uniref:Uncharacterized protein n=1 Tax=Puccinia graminis f. sp. tritici TaxID=56615 RepID=A0A5B0RKY9_PUCGR|nr:hypothetical protein PGTUg99_015758 [Puccinia graminis f. sp. tritici]